MLAERYIYRRVTETRYYEYRRMEKTKIEYPMQDMMLGTKRSRIKGTGPRRHELKPFVKLGLAPHYVVKELNRILDTHTHNDIGGDNYNITNSTDYDKNFGISKTDDTYRQILLQGNSLIDKESLDEYTYNRWDNGYKLRYTRPFLDEIFDRTVRFRLSEMVGHHEIKWHIDTDTSVACRAQICLTDDDSIFEFKTRDGVHSLKMKKGECWFINTGWSHRVVSGNDMRRTAVWSYHFDDVINKDLLWV
jgi:hypothetical protein